MLNLIEESETKLVTFEGKRNFLLFTFGFFVVSFAILWTSKNDQTNQLLIMEMSGLFAIATCLALYLIASTKVEIDRNTKTITYTKATIFKTKIRRIPFSDVHHVEARRQWSPPAGSQGSSSFSQVLNTSGVIVLQTGEELLISVQQGSNNLSDGVQGITTILAEKMATYIDVPFKDILPADTTKKPGLVIS